MGTQCPSESKGESDPPPLLRSYGEAPSAKGGALRQAQGEGVRE